MKLPHKNFWYCVVCRSLEMWRSQPKEGKKGYSARSDSPYFLLTSPATRGLLSSHHYQSVKTTNIDCGRSREQVFSWSGRKFSLQYIPMSLFCTRTKQSLRCTQISPKYFHSCSNSHTSQRLPFCDSVLLQLCTVRFSNKFKGNDISVINCGSVRS